MSQITLIRHGQAQTDARDEVSYDRLSPLGQQQATWLGEHLSATGAHFERVYSGTLIRHVETAQAMGHAAPVQDARLNEIEYFTLAQLVEAQHGLVLPDDREGFVTHLPRLFTLWQAGEIDAAPESFADFEARVSDALHEIASGRGPALVITSGGLIGMVLRLTMGLDLPAMARACLAIMNTSVHRLHLIGDAMALTHFNGVPHLEQAPRQFAQTHL